MDHVTTPVIKNNMTQKRRMMLTVNAVKIQKIKRKSNEIQMFFCTGTENEKMGIGREMILLQDTGFRLQVAACNL